MNREREYFTVLEIHESRRVYKVARDSYAARQVFMNEGYGLSRLTRFRKSRARRPDAREKIKEVASREEKWREGKK